MVRCRRKPMKNVGKSRPCRKAALHSRLSSTRDPAAGLFLGMPSKHHSVEEVLILLTKVGVKYQRIIGAHTDCHRWRIGITSRGTYSPQWMACQIIEIGDQ